MRPTSDLHVVSTSPLLAPATLRAEFPLSEKAAETVAGARDRIRGLLAGSDRRLLAIVGPCSIHDLDAARAYARKLLPLRKALGDRLEVVMRVYFEKPRTTTGWKGLIADPHLDGSHDMNSGLRLARQLLLELADMGMPAATEFLDPTVPQFIADLVTWAAIGARTTESQTHRQMASGLSMPVGFKNGTDGTLGTAVNAIISAAAPHHFLGLDADGRAAIVRTTGNPDCHLVLRGGKDGPNYDATSTAAAAAALAKHRVGQRLLVDCSHDNASKDHNRQPLVLADLAAQIRSGGDHLLGCMIESHLVAGKQAPDADRARLTYGQSITDACVDFSTTVQMLRMLADGVSAGRFPASPRRASA